MLKRWPLVLITLLLGMIVGTLYIFFDMKKYDDKIFPGVYVENFDVGGLSAEQAQTQLSSKVEEYLKDPIYLIYKDKKWVFYPTAYIGFDYSESIDRALSLGKSRFFLKDYFTIIQFKKNPVHIPLKVEFKKNLADAFFEEIIDGISIEPKDAYFKINGDLVDIVDDIRGVKPDIEQLKKEIVKSLWEKNKAIDIPVKQIEAHKTRENLLSMNIKVKVAEYSTKFNKSLKERTQNIRLAAEKINGHIIAPGEVFSFNDAVGERTSEKGYKEAPIFFKNETIPGIGGGVCQLSSTIYNLALLTDMEIIERSNHSLPVSYVPLGRDATVNYNVIDLKFKNNTGNYLMMGAEVVDDTLTVKFYGNKAIKQDVKFISEVMKKIPPPITIKKDYELEKGKTKLKEGSPGYQVRLWKVSNVNGKQEKVLVSVDTYNPVPSILYVGEKDNAGTSMIVSPKNDINQDEHKEKPD